MKEKVCGCGCEKCVCGGLVERIRGDHAFGASERRETEREELERGRMREREKKVQR